MKVSEAFPSNYLKAADLNNRTVRAIINIVKVEDIGTDRKLVMYFQGKDRGLVLNKTNAATIAMAFGDDTDGWGGAPIELFPQMVSFQGQMVPAIRVRIPPDDAVPAQAPAQRNGTFVPNARNRPAQGFDERTPPPADFEDEVPF